MNVLVVGGAGYVGSHTVKLLKESGNKPVIFDNLSRGHAEAIDVLKVPAVIADAGDTAAVERTLREHRIDAVMHFAAYALVGESVEQPLEYYRNNVSRTVSILDAMVATGVDRFVFSSTCAVYGEPTVLPITESERKAPMSPYGRSKLMVEQILADHLVARPSFSYAALRYFNAAGAAMDGTLGEDHDPETHLIPNVLRAALRVRPPLMVHGSDYPTPDGTAIRDYIHVDDLATAHTLALRKLTPGGVIACNLGTGRGFSVKEIIGVAERVTGVTVPTEWGPRRPGDPPALFADVARAREVLGWTAKYADPESIIASAWKWHQKHPHGYAGRAATSAAATA